MGHRGQSDFHIQSICLNSTAATLKTISWQMEGDLHSKSKSLSSAEGKNWRSMSERLPGFRGHGVKGLPVSESSNLARSTKGLKYQKIIAAHQCPSVRNLRLSRAWYPDICIHSFFEDNYNFALGLDSIAFGCSRVPVGRVGDSCSPYFLRERTYCQANFRMKVFLSWQILEPQINKIFGDCYFFRS